MSLKMYCITTCLLTTLFSHIQYGMEKNALVGMDDLNKDYTIHIGTFPTPAKDAPFEKVTNDIHSWIGTITITTLNGTTFSGLEVTDAVSRENDSNSLSAHAKEKIRYLGILKKIKDNPEVQKAATVFHEKWKAFLLNPEFLNTITIYQLDTKIPLISPFMGYFISPGTLMRLNRDIEVFPYANSCKNFITYVPRNLNITGSGNILEYIHAVKISPITNSAVSNEDNFANRLHKADTIKLTACDSSPDFCTIQKALLILSPSSSIDITYLLKGKRVYPMRSKERNPLAFQQIGVATPPTKPPLLYIEQSSLVYKVIAAFPFLKESNI